MEHRIWHSVDTEELRALLETNEGGLSREEAARRLEENGPNRLEEGKKRGMLSIFVSQFKDFMIWVLLAAALISGFLGEWVDTGIILTVVVINAIMGTIQESRAEAALEALKEMAAPFAKVLRGGEVLRVPASELVVGDVVTLEAGDSVPADLRLVTSNSLKVEESALTGESVPVEKSAAVIGDERAALGDRVNMAHMGTAATYGRGVGVVVATGMDTEMGKIAGQLAAPK
ncbi:MAG TPA: HAD-IC family P-type ATPase, partial [Oscillospiraceae bacterium]|nr:HAD-IC family P-type ATPase [Oscillospiraceae bacterium]